MHPKIVNKKSSVSHTIRRGPSLPGFRVPTRRPPQCSIRRSPHSAELVRKNFIKPSYLALSTSVQRIQL